MTFEFKGEQYTYPARLADITLGQRVSFYTQYGKELQGRVQLIETLDENERAIELSLLDMDVAVMEFAHYTGIELEVVRNEIALDSLLNIYSVDAALLAEEESNISLQPEYEWQDETWIIAAPELTPGSEMTLNEFLHGKEIVRQLQKLGRGKWDALPYLCAIYLRKKNEPFAESLVAEGSERLQLMHSLPLDIALSVAFFLTGTLAIYRTTLASSEPEVPES